MNAEILKKARKKLGLTQKEMADKLYISCQTYNGYENGNNIPKNKYEVINIFLRESNVVEKELMKYAISKNDLKDILIDILVEIKILNDNLKA